MKKLFVQQTVKNKKSVHKTGRKMGLYEANKLALPEKKKRFVSG